jgi:hypothetical protein
MISRFLRQHLSKSEKMASRHVSGIDYAMATGVNPWETTAT